MTHFANLDVHVTYGFHGYVPQYLFRLSRDTWHQSAARRLFATYEIVQGETFGGTFFSKLVLLAPSEYAHMPRRFFREPIAKVRVSRVYDGFELIDTFDRHRWLTAYSGTQDFVLEYTPRDGVDVLESIPDPDAQDAAVQAYRSALV